MTDGAEQSAPEEPMETADPTLLEPEIFVYPGVTERYLPLHEWEVRALEAGTLRRLLRPPAEVGTDVLDRIVRYRWGSAEMTLKKPWRNHLTHFGLPEGSGQGLTLAQIQDAGLPDETAFREWCARFNVEKWCWLATFEV